MRGKLIALVAIVGAAGSASALTTYDNFAAGGTNITSGWMGQCQRLTTPAIDNIVRNWSFQMAAGNTVGSVNVSIQTIVGGIPNGVNLWSSSAAVPGAGGVISFTNINLATVSGNEYAYVVDFNGWTGNSILFTTVDVVPGNGMWFNGTWNDISSLDQVIHIDFDSTVPEPASMLALASGAAVLLRRRRKA